MSAGLYLQYSPRTEPTYIVDGELPHGKKALDLLFSLRLLKLLNIDDMAALNTLAPVERGEVNRKELFLRACRGEALTRVPVWMMRQAGRYLPEYRAIRATRPFLEVCKTPDLAAEVSLQPFRILGVDAIIVFSDILIPAEAMGMHLELNDAGPNLPSPIRSAADVASLRIFDPETETKFLPEAIRRIVKSVGPDVPVLGFAAAPWTL